MIYKRALLLISTMVLSISWQTYPILSDTKVKLINRTPFAITLKYTNQDIVNKQGPKTIMPQEEIEILSVSRDKGVTSGKDFYPTVNVTIPGFTQLEQNNPSTEFNLKLKVSGNFIGSDMWQSASGPWGNDSWYKDRNLHQKTFSRGDETFTLSYKAIATGDTDNIEYALTWSFKYPQPKPTAANELNIGFQNTWMRGSSTAIGCVSQRAAQIADWIDKDYDVLVFAELFDSNAKILLDKLKELGYIYQTKIVGAGTGLSTGFINGGVAIVSKWPFATMDNGQSYKEMIFKKSCNSDDCLAAKGVLYTQIDKQGKKYHIFGTHTNASYEVPPSTKNVTARKKQFHDMKTFIDQQNIPTNEPIFMIGDMNVDMINPLNTYNEFDYLGLYQYKDSGTTRQIDEYTTMLEILNATHPKIIGYQGKSEAEKDSKFYTLNPKINVLSTDGTVSMEDLEYLDFILYDNDHLKPIESYNEIRLMTTPKPYNCTSAGISDLGKTLKYVNTLSDHWFVYGYFKFPE